jgi:hypothetical protein
MNTAAGSLKMPVTPPVVILSIQKVSGTIVVMAQLPNWQYFPSIRSSILPVVKEV